MTRKINQKIRNHLMTHAQVSAFEIYIADPAHHDPINDDDDSPAATDYMRITSLRSGNSLNVTAESISVLDLVLAEASNSADSERTKQGDGAARALINLSRKVQGGV